MIPWTPAVLLLWDASCGARVRVSVLSRTCVGPSREWVILSLEITRLADSRGLWNGNTLLRSMKLVCWCADIDEKTSHIVQSSFRFPWPYLGVHRASSPSRLPKTICWVCLSEARVLEVRSGSCRSAPNFPVHPEILDTSRPKLKAIA